MKGAVDNRRYILCNGIRGNLSDLEKDVSQTQEPNNLKGK